MKTTGVSDIPKFGLLDFLGHPNGNITPEKARKSQQMQFRDKTAYVRGLCYQCDRGQHSQFLQC